MHRFKYGNRSKSPNRAVRGGSCNFYRDSADINHHYSCLTVVEVMK